ncbi:hypothetical protein MAPG_11823 [Magnaporthiopsis poae ATCC 64411]|uniref:Uncharacterized protein n=1 Tax=Magnaporthiopsis poae (strain ATCC 64411 / 73-15) TaxID=644358 RepID=A0A0C4EG96_MAGP6|nr:hypothetical protein MAPG_11823 [Magnaporthiopsis poae ATCC 64411]
MPQPPIQINSSAADFDDIPQGQRSPAESERSNFTSISQRDINPRWNPPPPTLMPGFSGGGPPQQRPIPPNRNDVLLNNNPDFELPGLGGGGGPRGGGINNMI